ncbi:DMT family transporter [Fructobacillus americanaquae]|uniref:DMT family transporter n=1 Tax=Fructobacillus americanaquae TaxID=2940302 RepID=A0ABY5C088_9LACO|nr:DMT family transporter [Fructobacillus americanaquae]USS92167.1 DMT family transporter [Fructobacillus americanaquae]
MKNSSVGIWLAIIGSLFWGAAGTAAQFLFQNYNVSPQWLVGMRLLTSGFLLLAFVLFVKKEPILNIWRHKDSVMLLLAFAFLGMLPSQFTYFMAIKYGNAATATILQFTGPLFIIIFIALRQLKLPRRIDCISIIIAMIGTILLVTKGHLNALSLAPIAVFWGLLAGLSQASYTLIPKNLLSKFSSLIVVGWAMLLGSIPFIPIVSTHQLTVFNWKIALSLAFIIIFGTILSYLFYLLSLKFIEPAITGVLSAFEPLTATVLSVILLHLHLSFIEIVGAFLIILTAFLQVWPTQKFKIQKILKIAKK